MWKWVVVIAFLLIVSSVGAELIGGFIGKQNNVIVSYTAFSKDVEMYGVHTTSISIVPVYYQLSNKSWIVINENFSFSGCDYGFSICSTRDGYHNVQLPLQPGKTKISAGHKTTNFTLTKMGNFNVIPTNYIPSMKGNELNYTMPLAGGNYIKINYRYLPHMLKENIIFSDISVIKSLNLNKFTFSMTNYSAIGALAPIICDSNDYCSSVSTTVSNIVSQFGTTNKVVYSIPQTFIDSASGIVTLDPTISVIGADYDTHIVESAVSTYLRPDTENNLQVGVSKPNFFQPSTYRQSMIEWNFSKILPRSAYVISANMSLYVQSLGTTNNQWVILKHMDFTNATQWPPNTASCNTNCRLFTDIGNGTEYSGWYKMTSTGYFEFDLNKTVKGIQQRLNYNKSLYAGSFAIGLHSSFNGTGSIRTPMKFFSSEAEASARPKLTVVWKVIPQLLVTDIMNSPREIFNNSVNSLLRNTEMSNVASFIR